jgi:thiol-disulfide isomerase/thioredoxin
MKYYKLLAISLTIFTLACKSNKPVADSAIAKAGDQAPSVQEAEKPFDYHQQTSWLLGYFNPAFLRQAPHADWFLKGYDEYTPGSGALNTLLDIPPDGISIKIVMGTWCPDSRREVPRFMRVLDMWHFPGENVKFIGVDINKVSPVGEFSSLNIERVPTFIIYKNNIEAGRIIEVPKTSLEQDLVNILQGMNK